LQKHVLAHVHDQFEVVVNFGYGGAVGEQQHSSSSRATLFSWLQCLLTTPSMVLTWKLFAAATWLLLPGMFEGLGVYRFAAFLDNVWFWTTFSFRQLSVLDNFRFWTTFGYGQWTYGQWTMDIWTFLSSSAEITP